MEDISWEYFADGEIVAGMEKILDNDTVLDVLKYRNSDDWCWMVREWSESAGQYYIFASYDKDVYFEHLDDAYTSLCDYLRSNFPDYLGNDEILTAPEKSKKRFIMRAVSLGLAAALSVSALAGCGITHAGDDYYSSGDIGTTETAGYSAASAWEALDAANEIVVDKDLFNFGDHWTVYADGEHVADITGEFIKIWDCYVMRSTNGEFMSAEEENMSALTAHATKVGENGEERGYYSQNLSIFLTIEFIDANGNYTGRVAQKPGNFTLTLDIENADGTVAYTAKKDFLTFGARISIEKTGNGNMSAEDAIFGTVIANELDESSTN